MLELFIELTNQIFWDGYAQQLAVEDPKGFQFGYKEFLNSYKTKNQKKKRSKLAAI